MERSELLALLSPEGLTLLDSLPAWEAKADIVRLVSRLRAQGHDPRLVAAVLTQKKLRAKAVTKFGGFAERMLFTEAGLEQATRLNVAALHAGRFAGAGIGRVADLGCGIGGDALAFAGLELDVIAADRDEVTAAIASYNLAPFPNARVVQAAADEVDLSDVDAVFLDPARRTAGHHDTNRITSPADYSPSLDFAFGLAERMPAGVKLGPGLDRTLIPGGAEAQWISVAGQVVEMGLWFGSLARPGIRRSALLVSARGSAELTAPADAPDVETGPRGDYLYEPDGAVIRARLIGLLAERLDARMLSSGIAYLTADEPVQTPFATLFRVVEEMPADERALAAALRARRIGTLEIKKRGIDVDPATLRKRLQLRGDASATLVLTRAQGRHIGLLVERMPVG